MRDRLKPRDVDDRTRRYRREVDAVTEPLDFGPSVALSDGARFHFFAPCNRCGAVLWVTGPNSSAQFHAHWIGHHPIRSLLPRLRYHLSQRRAKRVHSAKTEPAAGRHAA